MSEEKNQIEEPDASEAGKAPKEDPPKRRTFFTRRRVVKSLIGAAIVLLVFGIFSTIFYRAGYLDTYIKGQFTRKMDEMNLVFDADVFQLSLSPLQLTLKNATFNNKITGEKVFFISNAVIGLSVTNLFDWQLTRDINVDSTRVEGFEAWILFDENGDSNFREIQFVKGEGNLNFTFSSLEVALSGGVINFGDIQRKIDAKANNFRLQLDPTTDKTAESLQETDPQFLYKFDLATTDSVFQYDESRLENIDISAQGLADDTGLDVKSLRLTTPVGDSTLVGTVKDWESPKYDLRIESTVDLTQTSSIFPLGTSIRGVGNFQGRVTGEGEKYRIEGEINSESLAADNIRLKAIKINASVDGSDSMYNANGKAIAEMLTFEDFVIDYPQLFGNIRGTGTDFRWIGELQAIAAKTPIGTITGLFIKDAVADYKEKKLGAELGNVAARLFVSDDVSIENIRSRNVNLTNSNGVTTVNAPIADASAVKTEDTTTRNVRANNLRVRDSGPVTDIDADSARADGLETEDFTVRNLSANNIRIRDTKGSTDINSSTLNADGLDANGVKLAGLAATGVNITDISGGATNVYSNNLKVASLTTDAAIMGSLNVAGVRLSFFQGRVEGRSEDIAAGNVRLTENVAAGGGNLEDVTIAKPVFLLEPSGRYRASADMSIGGGILGSVSLGSARAAVVAENEQIALNDLTAQIMDGSLEGDAVIALNNNRRSDVGVRFDNLELSKLLALTGGKVIPIEGKTSGTVDLDFPGTNARAASGTVTADFNASAGTEDDGLVPVNGKLGLTATNGLFNIDLANLFTEKSKFEATGRFDLTGSDSNLNLALDSTDASEIERIVRVLDISPDFTGQLDRFDAEFAGNLKFNGNLTGSLATLFETPANAASYASPNLEGTLALERLVLKNRDVGRLTTRINATNEMFELREGLLAQAGGGELRFGLTVPFYGSNNTSFQAELDNFNTGTLFAALPVDAYLPDQFQDFRARTSGTVSIDGIPNNLNGSANISSGKGTINGEPFDGFDLKAEFAGNLINVENFTGRFGEGVLTLNGSYQTDSTAFNFVANGENVNLARVRPFIPNGSSLPTFDGTVDLKANASGIAYNSRTYQIEFSGSGQSVSVNERLVGDISFNGKTEDQRLDANVTINFGDQPQIVQASVNFADDNLPFRAETAFSNTELTPIIALIRPEAVEVSGRATGTVILEGNLSAVNDQGVREFTTANLSGAANFSEFALQIEETPFVATNPIAVRFNTREVVVDEARFSGGGSNVVVSGTKAFTNDGVNNFSVDGKINLRIFNAFSRNNFFAGIADVSVRLSGVNRTSRLTGRADLQNASFATFIGAERLSFDRIKGLIIFTSNQAQIDNLSGFLGGGKVTASGGALVEGLKLQQFRLNVRGTNITAPLPPDFITTGDAEGEISGFRTGNEMNTLIRGTFNARRSVYTKDIDVADIFSGRGEGSLSAGSSDSSSLLGIPKLDIRIEGRDALVVRNNLADLTASASLRVTGDIEYPQISGRITANSGTIFFRNDRYDVQRGTLEFPPNTTIEPYINLQAETEIKGYQIIVSLVGNITDTESLIATVRSNPGLPQPDVISLITTGSLANTDAGIPTLAQSGINTAAEILTDSFINNPASRATDKLFGLNRFELDPIISGQRLNPSARLTVGRQINRNLAVTYSTNLSEDQNQVLALEYRVSNKISFVAQYEQRSLSNVTQRNNVFSFEVRLRKRF
ncbi:MAG: translocation/assembly module TamB domain-containing protein [Pyrinomonadaceae bacterium]|nr:translocation/assembly module TamB domain-containing protein [Pyrinomonadaceae bacterium]